MSGVVHFNLRAKTKCSKHTVTLRTPSEVLYTQRVNVDILLQVIHNNITTACNLYTMDVESQLGTTFFG